MKTTAISDRDLMERINALEAECATRERENKALATAITILARENELYQEERVLWKKVGAIVDGLARNPQRDEVGALTLSTILAMGAVVLEDGTKIKPTVSIKEVVDLLHVFLNAYQCAKAGNAQKLRDLATYLDFVSGLDLDRPEDRFEFAKGLRVQAGAVREAARA
jgi:hypothetical protein